MCEQNSTAFVDCRFQFSLTSLNPSNFLFLHFARRHWNLSFFSKIVSQSPRNCPKMIWRAWSHTWNWSDVFSLRGETRWKSFWESRVCSTFRVVSMRGKRWNSLARIGEEKQPLDDYINRIRLQAHNFVISIKKVGFAQRFLSDRKSTD